MKFKLFLVLLIGILSGCGNEPLKIKKIQGQQIQIKATLIQDSTFSKFIQPYKNKLSKEIEVCDLVICLSHLGYHYRNPSKKISDLSLAASTKNIDLIIGGHSHTFLIRPNSY